MGGPDRGEMKTLSRPAFWAITIFLALIFVKVGLSKLTGSSSVGWAARFHNWGYPAGSHFAVGVVELLSGIGLLLRPSRKPAAVTLIIVMTGALVTHLIHGELPRIIPPLILGTLAFCVFSLQPTRPTAELQPSCTDSKTQRS